MVRNWRYSLSPEDAVEKFSAIFRSSFARARRFRNAYAADAVIGATDADDASRQAG